MLEHILKEEDALQTLRELKRVLKSGGECIITTFNYALAFRLRQKKATVDFKRTNCIRYTRKEFHDLLLKVFDQEEVIEIVGIVNLRLDPFDIGPRLWKYCKGSILKTDLALERPPFSFLTGHLLLVKIIKNNHENKIIAT